MCAYGPAQVCAVCVCGCLCVYCSVCAVHCVICVVCLTLVCGHLEDDGVLGARVVYVGVNMLASLCWIGTQSCQFLTACQGSSFLTAFWLFGIILIYFSLCSILFTFLRISTETWQRINLFLQTALDQSVPLTGSLFSIDFKFKRCSEAEPCTSTNIADFTEGGQERQRCVFQS